MSRELAQLVRRLRDEKGLSRQGLAEAAGVSYPYLSQIESGERDPSIKTMARLADALSVSVGELAAAAPESWAGISSESLTAVTTLASRGDALSPVPSMDPLERIAGSLRRRLASLDVPDRLEVLSRLMSETAAELRGE